MTEHKYFILTQQGEKNNLPSLQKLIDDGWIPSREVPLAHSSASIAAKEDYSHALILLYKEIQEKAQVGFHATKGH